MTRSDIANDYRNAIYDAAAQTRRLALARAELTVLQHALCVREAQTIAQGVEGSNEAQRKANLTLTLESDADYRTIQAQVTGLQQEVADADAEVTATRELCRLLRLELAMTVSDGVREGALA